MSLTDNLHKGMVIRHEGQLFTVLDYRTARKGKQKPTVHVKLRSVSSGHTGERTLHELGKIEDVPTAVRQMQHLYTVGNESVFMDTETFEQYTLDADLLGGSVSFLVEEETYRIQMIEGQPIALQLPLIVVLEVVDTAPVEHAGGNSNVYKDAKLKSGIFVQVPLFIKTGDRIRLKTDNREYQGKEHH